MKPTTIDAYELRKHVAALCDRFKIEHRRIPTAKAATAARSIFADRCIYAPRITSDLLYAIALHEIGHLVVASRRGQLLDEAAVWAWVRDCALIWTSELDGLVAHCLGAYVQKYEPSAAVKTLFGE